MKKNSHESIFGIDYSIKNNCISIASEPINSEQPGWLIDNKSMERILGMLMPSSLEAIKLRLTARIDEAVDAYQLRIVLQDYLALDNLVNHPNKLAWEDHMQDKQESELNKMENNYALAE